MMLRFFWRAPAPSLRWRLLSLVSIAAVLIVGLAAALSYQQARHEVQELMDGQMTRMGRLMLAQVQQDATHLTNLPDLLDAQRSLFATQQAVVQVRLAQLQNQVSLYKALGGGAPEATAGKPS